MNNMELVCVANIATSLGIAASLAVTYPAQADDLIFTTMQFLRESLATSALSDDEKRNLFEQAIATMSAIPEDALAQIKSTCQMMER